MAAIELMKTQRDDCVVFGLFIRCSDGKDYAYPDISASRAETERLKKRMCDEDLSPLHYDDVARDYIIELAYERIKRNGLKE